MHQYSVALFILVWISNQFVNVNSHPQCLDFKPPFAASGKLNFCKDHSKYGCCGSQRDRDLRMDYLYSRQVMNESTALLCDDFLQRIICAECHPYAAHIYDAENPFVFEQFGLKKRNEVFPGLCKDYCLKLFDSCREVIKTRVRSSRFLNFTIHSSKEMFCSWATPSDTDYCLPDINSRNFKKNSILSNSKDIITLCLQDVVQNLNNPLFAVHANDGTQRLFIGEQRGLIYVLLADGRRLQTPFLNITNRVLNSGSSWDERGLLGLAFHPNFRYNGRFFVYYSCPNKQEKTDTDNLKETWWIWNVEHHIRVSEFLVSKNPYVADITSERVILEVQQPEANHEGGMLLFGDDGYLYIFVGDGGGAGDDHGKYGNSLNMSTLLGKVLRIDVDVYDGQPYTIPYDNPFVRKPDVRPEIYAYGIRNIWRCGKDRGKKKSDKNKGRIFCGDVGQNAHEEIDIIKKGGNYGWRAKEGFSCYDYKICNAKYLDNEVLPIISYNHSVGKSIVGGHIYRGCHYPNLHGLYFYADTVTGRIFSAKEDTSSGEWKVKEVILGNSTYCNNGMHNIIASTILSFGEDEKGEIYILSTSYPDPQIPIGRVYQLVDPVRREDPAKCQVRFKHPKTLRNLIPRDIYKRPTVMSQTPSTCVDKMKKCHRFQGNFKKCTFMKEFTKQYCTKSCGFC